MRDINEMIKNSLVSKGHTTKIKKVFQKALGGEDITVAFLGGSITQGCNATTHEECYAYRTYSWFRDMFTNVNVRYVNAGVGATGSILGVNRVKEQVLDLNPDIVFIDFAVNDKDSKYDRMAYDSLIRRILSVENQPALVEIFMSTFNGENVQEQQIEVGTNYNIPMVSFRNAVYTEMLKGTLEWKEVASDEVHPNNYGHFVISEILINLLREIYNEIIEETEEEEKEKITLGEPVFGQEYINSKRLDNKTTNVIEIEGFTEDSVGFQVFNNGWKFVSNKNENGKIVVEVEGKNIFLVYKDSIAENAGKMEIKVDGKEIKVIDTFFEGGWGDCTKTELLVEEDECKKHIIEVTIINEERPIEIKLMGFLVS